MTKNPVYVLFAPEMDGENISLSVSYYNSPCPPVDGLEYIDIPHDNIPDCGLRVHITEEKTEAGPIFVEDRLIFSEIILTEYKGDEAVPFHCDTCANQWCDWFANTQQYWASTYHPAFFRQGAVN